MLAAAAAVLLLSFGMLPYVVGFSSSDSAPHSARFRIGTFASTNTAGQSDVCYSSPVMAASPKGASQLPQEGAGPATQQNPGGPAAAASVPACVGPGESPVVAPSGSEISGTIGGAVYQISGTERDTNSSNSQLGPNSSSALTSAIPGFWLDYFDKRRRTRSQIYVEILELLKLGPMTPFEITFYARLNYDRAKECIEFLELTGYVQGVDEGGKRILALTKEGLGFLERAKALFQRQEPPNGIPNYHRQRFLLGP